MAMAITQECNCKYCLCAYVNDWCPSNPGRVYVATRQIGKWNRRSQIRSPNNLPGICVKGIYCVVLRSYKHHASGYQWFSIYSTVQRTRSPVFMNRRERVGSRLVWIKCSPEEVTMIG